MFVTCRFGRDFFLISLRWCHRRLYIARNVYDTLGASERKTKLKHDDSRLLSKIRVVSNCVQTSIWILLLLDDACFRVVFCHLVLHLAWFKCSTFRCNRIVRVISTCSLRGTGRSCITYKTWRNRIDRWRKGYLSKIVCDRKNFFGLNRHLQTT